MDKRHAGQEKEFRRGGKRLRNELEKAGTVDRYERMQPPRPTVDEYFIDARIEHY